MIIIPPGSYDFARRQYRAERLREGARAAADGLVLGSGSPTARIRCVMHFSNSLGGTDRKGAAYCATCQRCLERHEVR